jgi:peptide/nickel transport system substrate-binding protein
MDGMHRATERHLNRRALLRLFGLTAAGSVLSACGSVAAPTAPTPTPSVPQPASANAAASTAVTAAMAPTPTSTADGKPAVANQPKTGGTLRVADMDLPKLDGHLIYANGINISWVPYDRLTQYDDKLVAQPMLAESFDLSSDASQIRFTLRKGVQFHTGREFTSDDVRWNLLRVRDPKLGVAQLATQSAWFTSIDTPDKYSVVLKTDQPRPFMFDFFEYFNILDSETKQGPDADVKVVGTGPFVWQEYRQGDGALLVKNPNYWRSGYPYLDQLDIRFRTDQQSAVVAFESGEFDMLAPPVRDAVRLGQNQAQYRLGTNPLNGGHYLLAVNTTMPPGDSKPVRQALSYALDRKRIAEQVLLGAGAQPHSLPWPSESPAYDAAKDQAYAFDPDKAKSLLGGQSVPVEITVNSAIADTVTMAQLYQADLQQAGFNATIKSMDGPAILQYADMQKNPGLWINQSGYAQLGPQAMCTISRHWNIGSNAEGFSSDQYRQIVNGLATEPDAAKRTPLYGELNDFIIDEQFVIVVVSNPGPVVTRASVQNVRWDMHGARKYAEMWLA